LRKKGDDMAQPSRNDALPRNPVYPEGAPRETFSSGDENHTQRELDLGASFPSGDTHGQDRVSRSAEAFGRTVGHAVSRVLRFPERVGQAGSRLRHAGNKTRANASAVVLDMMDSAAQRADKLRRTTAATISDWTHSTRYKASKLGEQAADSWKGLRTSAQERAADAGRRVATQWNQTQRAVFRLREEDPARFLAVVAGTAFVIGAGIRIWRSSGDE
jgi:hypothetical protein